MCKHQNERELPSLFLAPSLLRSMPLSLQVHSGRVSHGEKDLFMLGDSLWMKPFFEEHAETQDGTQGITGEIRVLEQPYAPDILEVTVDLETRFQIACARCNEPFSCMPSVQERVFVSRRKEEANPRAEHRMNADDLDTYPMRPEGIALDEILLDLLADAIPENPLCAEECPGLCTKCGRRLPSLVSDAQQHQVCADPDCPVNKNPENSPILN